MPAIFHWSIDEKEVAANKDDEAHDGAGHVGGVAGQVSVNNFVKRLEMSYLDLHYNEKLKWYLVILWQDDSDVDDTNKLNENEDASDEFDSDLCRKTATAFLNRAAHSTWKEEKALFDLQIINEGYRYCLIIPRQSDEIRHDNCQNLNVM